MSMKFQIQDMLLTITDRHFALVNSEGGEYTYKIVEYIRTSKGIEAMQCKKGSLELMLDYAEHLVA